MDREVRKRHQSEKEKHKTYADEKRKARTKAVRPGDKIMIQQRKSTDPNSMGSEIFYCHRCQRVAGGGAEG